MIDVNPNHLETVTRILAGHVPDCEVRAFGSRATWTAKDYSDLDLAVVGERALEPDALRRLTEAFEESDLPFRVDVLDWHAISSAFRKVIGKAYEVVQRAKKGLGLAGEDLVGPLPKDWEYTTLGDACARGGGGVQTGPFGSQLHAADYVADGIPSIMPQNIADNQVVRDGIARITAEDAERLNRYLVRPGDIVYSRRGDVERRALIRNAEDGWLCGTGCLRVRFGEGRVDSAFASYYLGDTRVREWVVRHAHGATMPNLNTDILSALPFVMPPLREQRAIAHILGTLDGRIELNRRMNETLEAMARALFKSWFVDFDPVRAKAKGGDARLPKPLADLFPDSFEDSELGEIPGGWSAIPLYEIATYINGAAYTAFQPNDERRGLPIIKIAELKAGVTASTRFSDVQMPEKYRIASADILFSWSGNPDTSIDTFVWPHGPGWLNQHIFRVLPHSQHERPFVLSTLKTLRPVFAEIARNKQTTGLGHVTAEDMKRLLVARPDHRVMQAWNAVAGPLHGRAFQNALEIHDLATVRDTLLPKLISGELRVHNAERTVENVR